VYFFVSQLRCFEILARKFEQWQGSSDEMLPWDFFLEKRPKHGSGANDEDEKLKK
jgi:hypothetical protein